MKLTTKGRFAVTAMMDLALHRTQGPVTLGAISERQHISLAYLEQLFSKLRRADLVTSVRGSKGGYQLAKPPEAITVAQVMTSVEEPLDATQCAGKENCNANVRCMTHDLWTDLNRHMLTYLESISLANLVAKREQIHQQHPLVFQESRV